MKQTTYPGSGSSLGQAGRWAGRTELSQLLSLKSKCGAFRFMILPGSTSTWHIQILSTCSTWETQRKGKPFLPLPFAAHLLALLPSLAVQGCLLASPILAFPNSWLDLALDHSSPCYCLPPSPHLSCIIVICQGPYPCFLLAFLTWVNQAPDCPQLR